jgi:phage terminase large subunit
MLDESLHHRAAYRRHIESSGLQKHELLACRDDIIHWVNQWCYTYDPRADVKSLPFDLFPRQKEFLGWLAERESLREDGLVEKSRDMGVTWLCCTFALHRWLFTPGFSAGFGSRKLELVDRIGDADSIFEKIRFLLYGLPPWMLPADFSRTDHDNQARLINPKNGASLTGEGGSNIGRGGRKSVYFVDEAAFLERPEMTDRSLFGNTEVRIDVSTPNGPGNPFAQKRFSGKVKVFTFHWRDDPRKDDAWYAKVKAEKDAVTIAQEVDLDYAASLEGICIPGAWVRAAVGLDLPANGPTFAGLDVAEEGANVNALVPRRGPVVSMPVGWSQCNTTQTAHRAAQECGRLRASYLYYDVIGVGAGVRGALASFAAKLSFCPVAVNGGTTPTETRWPDGLTSKEKFLNLRAELWWMVRVRFEKTYEHVNGMAVHPLDELISIPNHPQLIADLGVPRYFPTETGKIQIESKKQMAKRGVKSPDYGDACVYSFHPAPRPLGGYSSGGARRPIEPSVGAIRELGMPGGFMG